MITVACVLSRPGYSPMWVERLRRMIWNNLNVPHRFVCITDEPEKLHCETKRLPRGLSGWWSKLALFKEGMLEPPVLYLDLDVLILGNLDFVTEYKGDFAILRDFYRTDGFGSGVMLWTKQRPDIYEDWLEAGCPRLDLGDQGWMEKKLTNPDRLQDIFQNKFVSWKVHGENLPKEASVLSFHGDPKNSDFPETHWVSKVWRGEMRKAA